MVNDLSLYFHLPFCTRKCPYCHFYVIPNRLSHQQLLSETLAIEIERQTPLIKNRKIPSIYFGGGTPALYRYFDSVLKKLPITSSCEITLEVNPEDVNFEKLKEFRLMGINRLSIGVQSLDDRSLQTLERIHSARRAINVIDEAAKAGFENISIDLMVDIPGQTVASLYSSLKIFPSLPIQHVSLYNLTIEPHTPFFKRKVQQASPETSLKLLTLTIEELEKCGLKRYEISAFSKPGYESKHNLGYWTGREFLGFGPSAFSYFQGSRFRNIANLNRYARLLKEGSSPIDFSEHLLEPEKTRELLAIRLRILSGVTNFKLDSETKKRIEKLKSLNLLTQEGATLKLSEKGKLFYDTVAEEII